MHDIRDILKHYWGYEQFRPLQEDIIHSILQKKDTLALLPTGGGKSICFQVPALAMEGICIVVSPLIALMKDQVENLKKRGIHAQAIYSGMSRPDVIRTLKNAAYEHHKFLYVSPERLETSLFKEYLPAMNVSLIAVDEAHCISQWGYDFRRSYLRIAALREALPGVPVLALTASATEEVQHDICEKLAFASPNIFRQSFERKNLSYSAFRVDAKPAKMIDILTKTQGTAIVYCKSRRQTGELAQLLQMEGISASNYHAGLAPEERTQRQKDWIENKTRVMVCTNAFGMGIDKPDVRVVIHAGVPDCLENYYQEAGRAGRDGNKSYAVLLYNQSDLEELAELHKKRYPSFEQIKEVYNAVVNFLQIPSYTGEYQSYTFRLDQFVRNFQLDPTITLSALKAMEGDGWLDFNERSFTPPTIMFTTSKALLYDFERSYPQYEPLLTTLLRTYEGIFDFPAFISELQIAKIMRKDEEEIRKLLKEAHSFAMIRYAPQKDEPQIIFRKHRVPVNEFRIDLPFYNKRKEVFIKRVQKMIEFTGDDTCRGVFINRYFGDPSNKSCGICDNCLKAKAGSLSPEEFQRIALRIGEVLGGRSLEAGELLKGLHGIRKEKAWQVIEFMQSERKIVVDESGLLSLG
jgi:ATP-dependent DNA helicase RecQ